MKVLLDKNEKKYFLKNLYTYKQSACFWQGELGLICRNW